MVCVCTLLLVALMTTGRYWEANGDTGELRQTGDPTLTPSHRLGHCQTDSPSLQHGLLPHAWCRTGTCRTVRPGARLAGSAFARIVRTWGYRGVRVGEASHPGPEGEEPLRVATIHRVPVGEKAPRSCSIRLTPQGGAWTLQPPTESGWTQNPC